MTTHTKIIIVGFLSFMLGMAITQIPYGRDRDRNRDMERMSMKSGTMQHRMPDGSMMGGDMKGGMQDDMSMNGMMQGMVANMKGKTGKDLEKAFLTDMIPHHQGAVEMAKMLVVDTTVSAELRAFAQQIITAQEGEIEKMNMWVKRY